MIKFMRLIIAIPYYRHGGVERVIISLITEFSKQIEKVIIVASPNIITNFQKLLPNSPIIIYESSPLSYNFKQAKIVGLLNKVLTIVNQTKIEFLQEYFQQIKNDYISNSHLNQIIFYFPSSFGIYKDHLTLLKAGLILAKKKFNFKIVLIGKETDKFIQGELSLSQQNQTKEYVDYLAECKSIYTENKELINQYFLGLGYCDNEEVEKWYQNSSCVVFPSKYEGFGLALSEAIVRGIPVIASDLEVFSEQVTLYQCADLVKFFPQGNAEALATIMEEFIINPTPKLSENEIKNRFHNWTWEKVAQEYIKLLPE